MKIHVTQQHINAGLRENCEECPVALAVAEHAPQSACVHVTGKIIAIASEGEVAPLEVVNFVRDFDAHRPVYPFTG